MNFKTFLKNNIAVLDGATGTMLQARGLSLGELPEEWNISRAQEVEEVCREYLVAGADVVYANTFGANCLKFGDRTEEIVRAGVMAAKRAAMPARTRT